MQKLWWTKAKWNGKRDKHDSMMQNEKLLVNMIATILTEICRSHNDNDNDDNDNDDDTHPPRIIVRVGIIFRRGQKVSLN